MAKKSYEWVTVEKSASEIIARTSYFNEMVLHLSVLYWTNTSSWIFIETSVHTVALIRPIISESESNSFCSYSLMLQIQCTNFIAFDLTRPAIEPTIYHIRGEQAYHIMWVFILLYIVLSLYDHSIGFICSLNLIWKRNLQNKSNWIHGSDVY